MKTLTSSRSRLLAHRRSMLVLSSAIAVALALPSRAVPAALATPASIGPPAPAASPASAGGCITWRVRNYMKTRKLTSWSIDVDGDDEFAVDLVTQADGTPLPPGVQADLSPKKSKTTITLTLCMNPGDRLDIKISYSGTFQSYTKPDKDYSSATTEDFSSTAELDDVVFVDSESISGGVSGRSHLGVQIPPSTYAYFYQVTNEDPVQVVQSLSLDLGRSTEPPFNFAVLDFPHDEFREDHEPDEIDLLPREARFEDLGPQPGVYPTTYVYDSIDRRVRVDFGAGLQPGQSSNVFYFFSPQSLDPLNLPDSSVETLIDGVLEVDVLVPTANPPLIYCTAKPGLVCGVPQMSYSGVSRASSAGGPGDDFTLSAWRAKALKAGLLLYTQNGAQAVPFDGGTLCVAGPVKRAEPVGSGGTPGGCDGTFSIDMNAFASGSLGGNPEGYLSLPGTTINTQWWGRDSLATGSFLSDALAYVVGP